MKFRLSKTFFNFLVLVLVGNSISYSQSINISGPIQLGHFNDSVQIPLQGMIRFDTSKKDFEGFDGESWKSFTSSVSQNIPTEPEWQGNLSEKDSISAYPSQEGSSFGGRFEVDEDRIIVSSRRQVVDGVNDRGQVYIFHKENDVWIQEDSIVASDGVSGDFFGDDVDISGNYAVVGNRRKTVNGNVYQGQAYIFKRSGNDWSEIQKLSDPNGQSAQNFGGEVCIKGDYLFVSAGQEGIFVYHRNFNNWVLEDKIEDVNQISDMDLSQNVLVVGRSGLDVGGNLDQGEIRIYQRAGTSWNLISTKRASNGQQYGGFGKSVAIQNSTIIVGAPGQDVGSNSGQGKAYIFMYTNGNWSEETQLYYSLGNENDSFGSSVSIYNEYVAVAYSLSNNSSGACFIFKNENDSWTGNAILGLTNGSSSDIFGRQIRISLHGAFIGAENAKNILGQKIGKIYIF